MEIKYLCDVPALIPQVRNIVFETWDRELGYTFEETATEARRWGTDKTVPFTLVAVERGLLIGTVSLLHKDFLKRPDMGPWRANLYVVPERRKNGIAGELIAALNTEAKALGFDQIYLWTEKPSRYVDAVRYSLIETDRVLGKPICIFECHL